MCSPCLLPPCLAQVLGKSEARSSGPAAARTLHRLELRAPALPPWVLDRVAAVLAVTQVRRVHGAHGMVQGAALGCVPLQRAGLYRLQGQRPRAGAPCPDDGLSPLSIFARKQDGNFSMACDTHPVTLALNWRPSTSSNAEAAEEGGSRRGKRRTPASGSRGALVAAAQRLTEYEARQRGCWDGEEAARWWAAVPGLSCNVVRELRCEGGTFTAKLSAKSAERVVL